MMPFRDVIKLIAMAVSLAAVTGYVEVTINGQKLEAVSMGDLMSGYEHYAKYQVDYWDGGIVDMACNAKESGGLRMTYNDADNKTLISVERSYSSNMNFRSYMKRDKDKSYLDCIFTLLGSQSSLFRTYFIWKQRTRRPHAITVIVNGLELVPLYPLHQPPSSSGALTKGTSGTATAEYLYYYIIGEPLHTECTVNPEPGASAHLQDLGLYDRVKNRTTVTEKCGLRYNHVNITYKSDLDNYTISDNLQVPRISGLRANNILYEYRSADNEWTVHYQYNINETLNLTCVSTAGANTFNIDFLWRFSGTNINSTLEKKKAMYRIKTNRKSFTLGGTGNGTHIICEAKLILRPNEVSSSKVFLILHATSPIVAHNETQISEKATHNDTNIIGDGTDDTSSLVLIIVGGTLGTVVIVVILCVPMVCRYMKSRIRTQYEYPNYENIDEDDRPIPIFPSQWNDYGESDSHYMKIDEGQIVDNNYYQGLPNETQGYYSEINTPVASGSDANCMEYAQVMKTGNRGRNDKYFNVLAGKSYANTSTGEEYVEPAYCSTPSDVEDKNVYVN